MKATRVLGWLLFVPSALAALALAALSMFTEWQMASVYVIYASTFIPFMWMPACIAILGLALLLHGWWRLLALALAIAAFVGWGVPILPRNQGVILDQARIAPDFTVVSLNVQYGRADVDALRAQITDETDAVALQEYTPAFEEELVGAGLMEEFPHRVGTRREDAGGTMLLSRTPVEIVASADTAFDTFVARTEVGGLDWHIGVIHSTPPQLGADAWARDGFRVNGLALQFVEERLVLVGDFNAIDEHHTMRILTKGPIHNAMSYQPSYGGMDLWQPTWPVGGGWPAFARIDHFLASDRVQTAEPRFFEVRGTDHKGLVAMSYADD